MLNIETFGRIAALGPAIDANLDPSHFFWMGMDGHKSRRPWASGSGCARQRHDLPR